MNLVILSWKLFQEFATTEDLAAVKDVQCDSASNQEICKIGNFIRFTHKHGRFHQTGIRSKEVQPFFCCLSFFEETRSIVGLWLKNQPKRLFCYKIHLDQTMKVNIFSWLCSTAPGMLGLVNGCKMYLYQGRSVEKNHMLEVRPP